MEELNTPIPIRNSNKLIALFMGGELVVENYHGINIIKLTNDKLLDIAQLKYHISWDWLIPVINKIYDLSEYYIYKYETQTFYSEGGIEINTKYIEETYKDVIEFIEWFNFNKK